MIDHSFDSMPQVDDIEIDQQANGITATRDLIYLHSPVSSASPVA